jgi:hypothetical protein
MKKYLIIVLLCLSLPSFATTYFVSLAGNDNWNGTEIDSAWQSLSKLSTQVFFPGDSILFKSGDTFHGQWNFSGTGNSTSDIYVGIYGGNVKAVISGSENVTGWTQTITNPNIYESDLLSITSQLLINNENQIVARFPNNGFKKINVSYGIYGFGLSGVTDVDSILEGSQIVVKKKDLFFQRTNISQISGDVIELEPDLTFQSDVGYGAYIDNNFSLLDTVNEWFLDTSMNKLFYYPAIGINPNNITIEASIYDYGINFISSINYLQLENIEFKNQSIAACKSSGNSFSFNINNCDFKNQYQYGISFLGTNFYSRISNNTFNNIKGMAVFISSAQHDTIVNNSFVNIGMISGYGINNNSQYNGMQSYYAIYNLIERNTFNNIGASAIIFDGNHNTFSKNIINNSVLINTNLPAISFFGINNYLNTISKNIITNTHSNISATPLFDKESSGINLSFFCHDFIVNSNTISSSEGYGLIIGTDNYNHIISNNILYNSSIAQINFNNIYTDTIVTINNIVKKNQLISLYPEQYAVVYQTTLDTISYSVSDSNYFYNPYNARAILLKKNIYSTSLESKFFTLQEWKEFSSIDSSTKNFFTSYTAYTVTDTIGEDLIANPSFTNNFNQWSTFPESASEMLLDNNVGMDGGCIKVKSLYADTLSQLESTPYTIVQNELYQLSFSDLASKKSSIEVSSFLYSGNYPNNGFSRFYDLKNTLRKENYEVFKAINQSYADNKIKFVLDKSDSVIWFDNIHLYPVTGFKNDSSRMAVLFTNYTAQNQYYSLSDSFFLDIDSNHVSDLTLSPYTSQVLFYYDTTTYTLLKDLNNLSIQVYPNPAQDFIVVSIFDNLDDKSVLMIYSIQGILIETIPVSKNQNIIDMRKYLSGTYILQYLSNKNLYTSKFQKIN